MTKVKLFTTREHKKLENMINSWLEDTTNYYSIEDIKIIPVTKTRTDIDSDLIAMVQYNVLEEE